LASLARLLVIYKRLVQSCSPAPDPVIRQVVLVIFSFLNLKLFAGILSGIATMTGRVTETGTGQGGRVAMVGMTGTGTGAEARIVGMTEEMTGGTGNQSPGRQKRSW